MEAKPESQIGPFLSGKAETKLRRCAREGEMFAEGAIHLSTGSIHTVKPLELDIPKGRLTVVTGVSGSGFCSMVDQNGAAMTLATSSRVSFCRRCR